MHAVTLAAVKMPHPPKAGIKVPKLSAMKVKPLSNGSFEVHHLDGGHAFQKYLFPNADKLVKHVAHTAKQIWEGGKSGMPRPRGSMQAHREKQLETGGY